VIEQEAAKGPVLVVDAGNLLGSRAVVRDDERAQAEEKARLLAASMPLGHIDAMLPGTGELAFGLSFVQGLAAEHALPYLAANLDCDGKSPFPASRLLERGGEEILVVGVVGNSVKAPECHVSEPIAAVQAAIRGQSPDVLVVLSGQKVAEDEALAEAVPTISLVVNGQERQQLGQPRTLPNGGLLLAAGSRGKQLGVGNWTLVPGANGWRDSHVAQELEEQKAGYVKRAADLRKRIAEAEDDKTKERLGKQADFMERKVGELDQRIQASSTDAGPKNAFVNRLVDLGTDIPDHAATAALVAAAKPKIDAAMPVIATSAVAAGPFAGSSACTGCHPTQAAQWGATAHARAYASLTATTNERDLACWSCHVTGALHPDGPKSPGAVAGLENVGCESCHGPGRAHVANPESGPVRRQPDEALCQGCHDGKQDGGRFDFATYLPKVTH
jgi:2',3'-cyclic-nucleotide 2'-phosphodiesterase (5'-nucleotidase family)